MQPEPGELERLAVATGAVTAMAEERLTGRVALVTGAGQGIGRGVAQALADEGASIVTIGRTEATVADLAAGIERAGGQADYVVGDVSSRSDVNRVVDLAITRFGRLDIVVNNAQSSVQRSLEDATDEDLHVAYVSGTLGSLYTMQAAFEHLKVRGGSVVNFGSNTAITGEPSFGAYVMAKEAIRGLTRVAAREWGAHQIRVNTVCPTADSPASIAWRAEHPELYASFMAATPLGRLGDPRLDIGRAVAALVSDDMRYLTGATLMLNGGRVMVL